MGSLPLVKWAMRLKRGHVEVRGELVEDVELPFGTSKLQIRSAPVRVELDFVGGAIPTLSRVLLETGHVEVEGQVATRLIVLGEEVRLDGTPIACEDVRIGRLAQSVLDRLGSVAVSARAEPDGDLLLRLGGGVEVVIPEGVLLTVSGASIGPPSELQLCAPLVVGFGGEGLRLSHEQFRLLSRLATVRLGSATLHPDGSVALEGKGATRGIELAMRAPLQRASARLSDMVRRSPNFQRVRVFLRHVEGR